jgi:hypothetical protein
LDLYAVPGWWLGGFGECGVGVVLDSLNILNVVGGVVDLLRVCEGSLSIFLDKLHNFGSNQFNEVDKPGEDKRTAILKGLGFAIDIDALMATVPQFEVPSVQIFEPLNFIYKFIFFLHYYSHT